MILQNRYECAPMSIQVIPKDALAQWEEKADLTDIDRTSSLELLYQPPSVTACQPFHL